MDINMPRMSGINATLHATSDHPILRLSVKGNPEDPGHMTKWGAV